MKVAETTVRKLELTDTPNHSPIRVYLEDEGGRGRVTISCYDAAWTGWWGALDTDLISFFLRCGPEYLATCMGSSDALHHSRQNSGYLARLIKIVQHALRTLP